MLPRCVIVFAAAIAALARPLVAWPQRPLRRAPASGEGDAADERRRAPPRRRQLDARKDPPADRKRMALSLRKVSSTRPIRLCRLRGVHAPPEANRPPNRLPWNKPSASRKLRFANQGARILAHREASLAQLVRA